MELNCPKCHSEQTQKISAIVDSGTIHSSGTTSNVGIGSVGGQLAVGSSSGITNAVHTTALAKRFPKPRKKSENAILVTVVLGALVGWLPPTLLVAMFMSGHGSHTVVWATLFAATVFVIYRWSVKTAAKNKEYNDRQYPGEAKVWERGFYCHRCEHVFVPE